MKKLTLKLYTERFKVSLSLFIFVSALLLIGGCVNWTPAEYYDVPIEIEQKEKYAIESDCEEPLGTFNCSCSATDICT